MNKLVQEVLDDYNEYIDKMQDNDYSTIRCFINIIEDNYNGCGAKLDYNIDIKGSYLYLNDIRLCKMNEVMYFSQNSDAIVIHLNSNKEVYIIISWVEGYETHISQVYINYLNKFDKDGELKSVMIYNQ